MLFFKFEFKLIKFYLQRLQGYFGLGSFAILVYNFVIKEKLLGLEWYQWIGIMTVTFIIVLHIDLKYILPRELKYGYEKNKPIKNEFKEIKQLIRGLNENNIDK